MDYLDQALKFIYDGRLEEARAHLEEQLKEDPDNTDILYNLGMTYVELGEAVKAIELLQRCLQLDPEYSNGYVALGFAYSRKGDLQKAKLYTLRAVETNPKNSFALKSLGALFLKENDNVKSLYYLNRASDLNPYDPQIILWLAFNYKGLKDIERAEKHFRDVLEMNAAPNLQAAAKEGLQELAVSEFESMGLRMDAVFFLLEALRIFEDKTLIEVQGVALEIAMLGRRGLDLQDTRTKHTLMSLPGHFTVPQLVCLMYAGFQRVRPGLNLGIDLSEEYELASGLAESEDVL